MARCIGWCRASPPICWRGSTGSAGSTRRISILGKILAQAYDTAAYKIAADDLLASHRVDILFHALGAGVAMQDERRIEALMVETKAGRQAVAAELFLDCSGDGDLAAWAGARFEVGDNAGSMLYPSMMFRLNGIDPERAGEAWRTIPALMEKAEASGTHRFPRKAAIVRPQRSPIEWRVNFTQLARPDGSAINGLDPDDLTRGEIDGRRQAIEAFNFLRTVPGFEKSYIVDLPPQLGIRETRRVVGGYMLSGDDVLGCAAFEDSIGVNGWPMETHIAGDVIFKFPPIPQSRGFNELPYRMLVPEAVDNLLMAGRCASMTHDGQSAARVSGACLPWAKPPAPPRRWRCPATPSRAISRSINCSNNCNKAAPSSVAINPCPRACSRSPVIPGRAAWRGPGIHNHERRCCAKLEPLCR